MDPAEMAWEQHQKVMADVDILVDQYGLNTVLYFLSLVAFSRAKECTPKQDYVTDSDRWEEREWGKAADVLEQLPDFRV